MKQPVGAADGQRLHAVHVQATVKSITLEEADGDRLTFTLSDQTDIHLLAEKDLNDVRAHHVAAGAIIMEVYNTCVNLSQDRTAPATGTERGDPEPDSVTVAQFALLHVPILLPDLNDYSCRLVRIDSE